MRCASLTCLTNSPQQPGWVAAASTACLTKWPGASKEPTTWRAGEISSRIACTHACQANSLNLISTALGGEWASVGELVGMGCQSRSSRRGHGIKNSWIHVHFITLYCNDQSRCMYHAYAHLNLHKIIDNANIVRFTLRALMLSC